MCKHGPIFSTTLSPKQVHLHSIFCISVEQFCNKFFLCEVYNIYFLLTVYEIYKFNYIYIFYCDHS